MSSPLHIQPDVVLSSELHSGLDMRRFGGIDNVNRVALATAGVVGYGQARVVVEIVPGAADGIVHVEEDRLPFSLN